MAMGKTGLLAAKPHVTDTTAGLLIPNNSERKEHKKETKLQLRIEEDKLEYFKEICEANGTNMSSYLRQCIDDVILSGKLQNG